MSFFSFFFLLSLCFFQIHARNAQYFNKVSPTTTPAATTSGVLPAYPTGIVPSPKDETLNNNQENQESFMQEKQEQDPTFVQETQNAYGLYGPESTQTQFPTTTTKLAGTTTTTGNPATTYTPYKTQETYSDSNNYEQYTNNAYGEQQQQQNSGESRFQESTFATDSGDRKTKNNYYSYNNGGTVNKNVERQGMSDTRFMENGKYYYDAQNENNYFHNARNNNNNNYETRPNYNTNNNENSYEFNNMENFQNQNQNQEEFQENEQYVP